MSKNIKNIFFFGHVYVSCATQNCDINMFISHDHIVKNDTSWIGDNIKCELCKKFVLEDFKSVTNNITKSKTLDEYKRREDITNKIKSYNGVDCGDHKCELDMYFMDGPYDYNKMCKIISKSAYE